MELRLVPILLLTGLCTACATPNYKSPAPTRAEVADVRSQIESAEPDSQPLSFAEAQAISYPIYSAIRDDAARICRTVSEADTCVMPAFEILDVGLVNARAGFDQDGNPTISMTRGLVEHFAEEPDELALVIGHEYGHLIAAHIEEGERNGKLAGNIMGTTLSILAATSMAVANGNNTYYGSSSGPVYSQQQINEVLQGSRSSDPKYRSFSKGQELEADYIGTYLATRSGYSPTGSALIEISALEMRDGLTPVEKQDQEIPFAFWDTHPNSADRTARVRETLEEIDVLKAKGYARPIPPRLILDITDNNEAFHSLEELIAPLPETPVHE